MYKDQDHTGCKTGAMLPLAPNLLATVLLPWQSLHCCSQNLHTCMFLAMPLRASACASARSPERTSMHPLSVTTRSMSDVGRYSPVAKDPNTCDYDQTGGA